MYAQCELFDIDYFMHSIKVKTREEITLKPVSMKNEEKVKTMFKIKDIELKKAWDFLCELNDQLTIDQKLEIGQMPWASEHYLDPEYYDDMIEATNNIYKDEIKTCGQAIYISHKNGRAIFISERKECLMSGGITDIYQLCKGPYLTDKYGNVRPEYAGKLIPGEFILWRSDYDVRFQKHTSEPNFETFHHRNDVQCHFILNHKNLTQLFLNIQNNENDMWPKLHREAKVNPNCFIATAVYGSPYANEVIILQEFRDNWLLRFSLGRAFVSCYYQISPPVAHQIVKNIYLKKITKSLLIIPILKLVNYLMRKGVIM